MFNSVLPVGPSYTGGGVNQIFLEFCFIDRNLWQRTVAGEFLSKRKREVTV